MVFKPLGAVLLSILLVNCKHSMGVKTIENVTNSSSGHTLHHNGVFSRDGEWVVFDGRNDDTKIGETSEIGIVNVKTGKERIIYKIAHQTVYGPGVGAVSFSPADDKVIFIHGLQSADENKPYAISRRTGAGIDIRKQQEVFYYDARDVTPPYIPGSLRGGTHSHCWSGDGRLISFTYNDEFANPDLRMVGVMVPVEDGVKVDEAEGNNHGRMYSAIVTDVVRNPVPGSDEINKAFDECWIGTTGYTNSEGKYVPYAIAFQGNVLNKDGELITEIFISEIDETLITLDSKAVGGEGQRPAVPKGISQKRLTFTKKGLSDTRHWLRSSPDGKYIYALAKDENGCNQIVQVDVISGMMIYLTQNDFSISYSFNLSHNGNKIAYVAADNVYLFDFYTLQSIRLTDNLDGKIIGAPLFSPTDELLVFNQYVKNKDGGEFLQIRKVSLSE